MSETRDDFYVGYLPIPARQRVFMRRIVAVLFGAGLLTAAISAAKHADPGAAQWDTEHITVIEGIASVSPYAMVRSRDTGGGSARITLIVSEGKHGAIDRLRPFEGKLVRVRGHLLERDGRRLLELESSRQGVELLESAGSSQPASVRTLGRVTLRGEIIDPKCYFGAMKPGEGKVHKECAALCIAGGIPPMLRGVGNDGRAEYYLLVTSDGNAANELVLADIGEPVEVSGFLERYDDLPILRISPGGIRSRQ